MEEYSLICEDTIDGILTAVYEAYQIKKNEGIESHDYIHIETKQPHTLRLFTHYETIITDMEKSAKVSRTIKQELGQDTFYDLCLAMLSHEEGKADSVYHTIVTGLRFHDRQVLQRLQESAIHHTFSCARGSNNELMHLRGFLRFEELENGILYAKIAPKSNILAFLMPHFSDRLPSDNFVIFDENRRLFGLHPRQKQWYMVSGQEFDEKGLVFSKEEQVYQELFIHFCEKIAIEARKNPKLQMNMLPLRFRPYMTEFKEKWTIE